MAPEQPTSTQEGSESTGAVIQVQCDCGSWLKAETQNQRVKCECGKLFAVTVTDITPVIGQSSYLR